MVEEFDGECWTDCGRERGGFVHMMDAVWSNGGQKLLLNALQEIAKDGERW